MQKHHGIEVGDDGVEAEGRVCGVAGEDAKSRNDLELVVALAEVGVS